MASLPKKLDQAMQDKLTTAGMELAETGRKVQEQIEHFRLLLQAGVLVEPDSEDSRNE